MKRRVVDTNVGIVANGRDTNATPACRLAALEALASIVDQGSIVVDTAGEMQEEYRKYFSPSGQPGVGDRFFQMVLMSFAGRVERVELEKRADGAFVDFPADGDLAGFDFADRKFAAAARKLNVPVLNAVDSDWLDCYEALVRNGIAVDFVCGLDSTVWIANGPQFRD
jgi:hypothetical protein